MPRDTQASCRRAGARGEGPLRGFLPRSLFHVEPLAIKELRSKLGLSQTKFANLLRVDLRTLRNREQDRREPAGPARALLTAIRRDPTHVRRALAAG